jgi:hypothetical protein
MPQGLYRYCLARLTMCACVSFIVVKLAMVCLSASSHCCFDSNPTYQRQVDDDVAGPASGSVFCFLPVGSIRTGLPVYFNASFQVTKDRRHLWAHGMLCQRSMLLVSHSSASMHKYCFVESRHGYYRIQHVVPVGQCLIRMHSLSHPLVLFALYSHTRCSFQPASPPPPPPTHTHTHTLGTQERATHSTEFTTRW